jgi:antitoxin (DNA-binding transcriptional repressor) of toxin-antitoxin stability system
VLRFLVAGIRSEAIMPISANREITISEARKNFSALIEDVQRTGISYHVIDGHNHKPVVDITAVQKPGGIKLGLLEDVCRAEWVGDGKFASVEEFLGA